MTLVDEIVIELKLKYWHTRKEKWKSELNSFFLSYWNELELQYEYVEIKWFNFLSSCANFFIRHESIHLEQLSYKIMCTTVEWHEKCAIENWLNYHVQNVCFLVGNKTKRKNNNVELESYQSELFHTAHLSLIGAVISETCEDYLEFCPKFTRITWCWGEINIIPE